MKNLVFRTPQKMLRFLYFREEGGGQEEFKNFLIFFPYYILGGEVGGPRKLGHLLYLYSFFLKASLIDAFLWTLLYMYIEKIIPKISRTVHRGHTSDQYLAE